MSFDRFVEIGRVVLINYGPEQGKLATIIDVVDGNRALIDGPYTETGVSRQVINFKRLSLTDYKLAIGVNAGHKALTAAWKKAGVQEKWNASSWGRRVAGKQAKAEQSDFDRFTAQVTKQKRSYRIKKEAAVLRKAKKTAAKK